MSWQTYVDSNLVGTGEVSQAAILGLAGGGSVWAKSSDLNITNDETRAIVAGFAASDKSSFQTNGLRVGGVKYMVTQAEDDHVFGRKGGSGVVIYQSKQALLVGVYPEGKQAGNVSKVVGDLADYMKSTGY